MGSDDFGADHGVPAAAAVYDVGGLRLEAASPGFAEALSAAHLGLRRPRCLCVPEGVEMYVARLAGTNAGFIVKRMPNSGCHHAPACPSYEPPADASGLGQVLGSAITEDPATGRTTLKLDFPMSKIAGRSAMPAAASDSDRVTSSGTRLSLRALLHYLWDQAELTRWQPRFTGKRTWGTVRRHLLMAAENKLVGAHPLRTRLYVPEVFRGEQREAINARRTALWSRSIAADGQPRQLMLLIAEVKEIVPARYGFKAVVKHMPDQAFALDEQLYRRLGRRFESELAMWGAADDVHMVMIATFSLAVAGVPTILELSLMPVTQQWLPIEDAFEKQLVERLVGEERSFVKGLRYNLGRANMLANATLTDCAGAAPRLHLTPRIVGDHEQEFATGGLKAPSWFWDPSVEAMPPLPPRHVGWDPPAQRESVATWSA